MTVWIYTFGSIFLVSLISLIGIVTLGLHEKFFWKIVLYLVSFSAGALFGDVFIHLVPEIVGSTGFTISSSLLILWWIVFGFITEKIIHRNHCHMPITKTHVHSFAIMNLVGDFVHNIIDGLIIAASFLVSIPLGIATSIAIVLHEIPQEIWDYAVLIHGWFSKKKALLVNFLTALSAFIGWILALLLSWYIGNITHFLLPFAAGSFLYIAWSDLIPELHKENKPSKALIQLLTFLLGIWVMCLLLLIW